MKIAKNGKERKGDFTNTGYQTQKRRSRNMVHKPSGPDGHLIIDHPLPPSRPLLSFRFRSRPGQLDLRQEHRASERHRLGNALRASHTVRSPCRPRSASAPVGRRRGRTSFSERRPGCRSWRWAASMAGPFPQRLVREGKMLRFQTVGQFARRRVRAALPSQGAPIEHAIWRCGTGARAGTGNKLLGIRPSFPRWALRCSKSGIEGGRGRAKRAAWEEGRRGSNRRGAH